MPRIVYGTVVGAKWTGWMRDWCSGGEPTQNLSCQGDEMSFGGEINRAELIAARDIDGRSLPRLVIGYPAHALLRTYREAQYLVIDRAPASFASATGIALIAVDYKSYDPTARCVEERDVAHVDAKDCRDPTFHTTQLGKCVPVEEYLAHYARPSP